MIVSWIDYGYLEEFTKDILSVIKPTEDDLNKRLGAIKEIANLVGAFRGAAVKPFGSFASNLYAKSGDLDVSVELSNDSGFPTSKTRRKKAWKYLEGALKYTGVARDVQFIPTARVPVLKYLSNHYGISCDISIDNYSGRIKSKVLYWISTIDDRFGDMVLLVKEWARAQNINDPKNGTLSSYTLCLFVIDHFQHCKPAILPPLREIFKASIAEGNGVFDQIWKENLAKFQREQIGQRNQRSLSHLLGTFFEHVMLYCLQNSCQIVDDPFDRSGAIITVTAPGLQRIRSAFERAQDILDSGADWNDLLQLMCTPEVCSKLGARAIADRYTNHERSRREQMHTGSTGSGPIRRPQGYNSGRQSAAPY